MSNVKKQVQTIPPVRRPIPPRGAPSIPPPDAPMIEIPQSTPEQSNEG